MANFAKALALMLQGGERAQAKEQAETQWLIKNLGLTPQKKGFTRDASGAIIPQTDFNQVASMNIQGQQTPFFMPGDARKELLGEDLTQKQMGVADQQLLGAKQQYKTGELEREMKEYSFKKTKGEIVNMNDLTATMEKNFSELQRNMLAPVMTQYAQTGQLPKGYATIEDFYKDMARMATDQAINTYIPNISKPLIEQMGGEEAVRKQLRVQMIGHAKEAAKDVQPGTDLNSTSSALQQLQERASKPFYQRASETAADMGMDFGSSPMLQNVAGIPGQFAHNFNPIGIGANALSDKLGFNRESMGLDGWKQLTEMIGVDNASLIQDDNYIDPMHLTGKITANNKMIEEAELRANDYIENALKKQLTPEGLEELESRGGLPISKINSFLSDAKKNPTWMKKQKAGANFFVK